MGRAKGNSGLSPSSASISPCSSCSASRTARSARHSQCEGDVRQSNRCARRSSRHRRENPRRQNRASKSPCQTSQKVGNIESKATPSADAIRDDEIGNTLPKPKKIVQKMDEDKQNELLGDGGEFSDRSNDGGCSDQGSHDENNDGVDKASKQPAGAAVADKMRAALQALRQRRIDLETAQADADALRAQLKQTKAELEEEPRPEQHWLLSQFWHNRSLVLPKWNLMLYKKPNLLLQLMLKAYKTS